MSTRVTSAIASRKARENLIRLLFPIKDHHLTAAAGGTSPVVASSKPHAHGTDDRHSHNRRRRQRLGNDNISSANDAADYRQKRHSYSQLRTVYLQKVHAMHPDKIMAHRSDKQQSTDKEMMTSKSNTTKDAHLQFIDLKNAWEEYHASVRIVQRRSDNDVASNSSSNKQYSEDDFCEEEDNFTMFGVGCSFADSPEERDLRNEIMEQACRGWFSSGSLSCAERENHQHGDTSSSSVLQDTTVDAKSVLQPPMKLSDDDMFVCGDDQSGKEDCSKRKYLVQNVDRFRRK